jgi:DNA repair protein RecO (recombination protein O)
MALYRDHGIVLRTYKLGEADRIVVFLTREHGKVRGVAKGVRKTGSRFGAKLEPTAHLALQLYEGRGELETVTQVEVVDRFPTIRGDYDRYGHATVLLEAVDQFAREGEPDARLYQMLLGGLRTLEAGDGPLVVAAFLWKLLAYEGFSPLVDACAGCGTDEGLVAFELSQGGVLCRSCRRGSRVTPEALELLAMVLGGRLNEALALPASPVTVEVDHLATVSLEHAVERRLRSVAVLEQG